MYKKDVGGQRNILPDMYHDFLCCCLRWMYWTDWEEDAKESKRGRIERAWMDGSNRNVFLSSKTVLWPNGLSLDIPQGILYWVDAYYDRIEMVYLNSSERKVSTSSPSPASCY